MATRHDFDETLRSTIAWPPMAEISGRVYADIDERTIDNYPFKGHHQAMVAAEVHIDIARHAAGGSDKPKSDNHARVAFENAVIAKQCLHYAYDIADPNGPDPTDQVNKLVAAADQIMVDNQRKPLPYCREIEDQIAQDLEIALAEAEAHHATLVAIKPLIKDLPVDDLLAEEVAGNNMPDDDHEDTPEVERNKGMVRMSAYLGDPPRGRQPEIRALTEYRTVLTPLVEEANGVIFAHELKVKQVVGDHAAQHGADIWGMTDELWGTEGIEVDTHTCDPECRNFRIPHHHNGHSIFMAFMHNGVRYIQAATEPFPPGFPRSRALQIAERIREYLSITDDNLGDPYPALDDRPYWRILHDLNGAITVGVHDISPLSLTFTVEDITKEPPAQHGLMQHVLHAIALDNLHAARFLAGATMPTKYFAPDERQVKAVTDAAQQAGMDAHQVAYLAEALYQDPAKIGVIQPATTGEIAGTIKDNHVSLPEENRRHLTARLTNP